MMSCRERDVTRTCGFCEGKQPPRPGAFHAKGFGKFLVFSLFAEGFRCKNHSPFPRMLYSPKWTNSPIPNLENERIYGLTAGAAFC